VIYALAAFMRLVAHGRADRLGWTEKVGMIVIAALILKVVIYAGLR